MDMCVCVHDNVKTWRRRVMWPLLTTNSSDLKLSLYSHRERTHRRALSTAIQGGTKCRSTDTIQTATTASLSDQPVSISVSRISSIIWYRSTITTKFISVSAHHQNCDTIIIIKLPRPSTEVLNIIVHVTKIPRGPDSVTAQHKSQLVTSLSLSFTADFLRRLEASPEHE